MLANRLILFIGTLILFDCTVSKTSAIRETILDFDHVGYLSSDLFQVSCDIDRFEKREVILEKCRKKVRQLLATGSHSSIISA